MRFGSGSSGSTLQQTVRWLIPQPCSDRSCRPLGTVEQAGFLTSKGILRTGTTFSSPCPEGPTEPDFGPRAPAARALQDGGGDEYFLYLEVPMDNQVDLHEDQFLVEDPTLEFAFDMITTNNAYAVGDLWDQIVQDELTAWTDRLLDAWTNEGVHIEKTLQATWPITAPQVVYCDIRVQVSNRRTTLPGSLEMGKAGFATRTS